MNHIANYLKKLTIENFQSHVKTTIEPAPPGQLTVITGPSDSGKTAVLRAGRWVFNNQPQGADFIRVGASFARTTVDYASGHTVIRERTKATNRYKIVAPGADGAKTGPQVFEGFGSSVPLEVQEITGVRSVKIGDLELNLNLAEQLSGPFLGSSISSGARAKVLGKLAGTEEIDLAAKQLGTDLYRRNQDEKRLTGEVAALEEKLREYDWLPAAKAKIEALERLVERIKAAQGRRVRMTQLKEQLEQVDEKITACHTVLYKWRNLKHAEQLSEKIKTGQEMQNKLVSLKGQMAEADAKITAAQAVLYRWRNLEQTEELTANVKENQRCKEVLIKLANSYWTFEKSIMACKKIIAKHAWLPEAEEKLYSAQKGIERVKRLRNLKAGYLSAQETIQKNQEILSRLQGIDQAGEIAAATQEKVTRRDILLRLARSYGKIGTFITQEQVKVEALKQVAEAENLLRAVVEKRLRWEKLIILRDKHMSLTGLIEDAWGKVVMWENRVTELQGAYQDELSAAGICPMCGQVIDYQKIKEAV